MKTARDHQVDHQEEIIFKLKDDSLTQPAKTADHLAGSFTQRRVHGPQDEGIQNSNLSDRLLEDSGPEGVNVGSHVGQFGHRSILYRGIGGTKLTCRE